MIRKELYHDGEENQSYFSNPPIVVKENGRFPLVSYAGTALVRDLVLRLSIRSAIDSQLSILKRHKPYHESDHVLNLVYRLMREVLSIEEEDWKSSHLKKLGEVRRKPIKRRRKRKNHRRAILSRRKPHRKRKGETQIASFFYQPIGWEKAYRFVVKRTEVLDESGKLYLKDDLCQYIYHVVVTNSTKSDSHVMSIAQGRANQENLIKDFKYGLGLSHVPNGFLLANRIYFKIAALAWNIKTWMLNLLKIGSGATLRFKRFLYLWIYQACIVSRTAVNTIVLRMNPGNYFTRLSKALRDSKLVFLYQIESRLHYQQIHLHYWTSR